MSDINVDEQQSSSIKTNIIIIMVSLIMISFILFTFVLDKDKRKQSKGLSIAIHSLIILIAFFLTYFFIGYSTANETCLPKKINNTMVFTSSLWSIIFSGVAIGLVIFAKAFFQYPFISLFGENLGYGFAIGVNTAFACMSSSLITYFTILRNGCSP